MREAVGRALATDVTASRAVPQTDRAAVDGWAVRASDTVGASARAPAVLRVARDGDGAETDGTDTTDTHAETPTVSPETAVPVDTGEPLPAGADAVVRVEATTRVGDELEVARAVPERGDVVIRGEDVTGGQQLYRAGHRLRAGDLGLLRAVGREQVTVAERPRVAVFPTGDELVGRDPDPGETLETNGVVVERLTAAWGGDATVEPAVPDEPAALRARLSTAARGLDTSETVDDAADGPAGADTPTDADVIVTVGGTAVGGRDHLPSVVAELSEGDGNATERDERAEPDDPADEPFVRGVAAEPGHPTTLGVVGDTPVVCLPGYPVACVVAAVQFLRPAVHRLAGGHTPPHPTTEAELTRKVASGPGVRTFAPVRLGDDGTDTHRSDTVGTDGADDTDTAHDTNVTGATPTDGGTSARSTLGLADGWVVVPESREGYDTGEAVTVELWERPAAGPADTVGGPA